MTDPKAFYWKTTPAAYGTQARMLCNMTSAQLATFASDPVHQLRPDDVPFLCLDIDYAYQLLTAGLGMNELQVQRVQGLGWDR